MSVAMSKVRSLSPALFVSAALLAGAALSGCAPVIARQGFQVQDSQPRDVKVGEDTKSSVLARLGSPSAVSTFQPNIWYYISQTSETYAYHLPQVSQRDVVVITFDKSSDQVTNVDTLGFKDGHKIAYSKRETPTRGRELTALEQLLGNVGRQTLPPTDENSVPGGNGPY
jgi:outer membrane protein assembly factor BamE (lipoprotein component of BamABCDE complex)